MVRNVGLLSVLIVFCFQAPAQYIEEQGSLESIYENRARGVLNSILRPTDYSVVVSIELDRDEAKLKEFQDTLELNYLPGMPMMGQIPALPSAANKLHDMRAKTEVSILISKNITPDVEKVIRDIVASKLHLDESAGDSVAIKRVQVAPDAKEPVKPDLLPDLSWKMWALVVIISLLAIAGIALIFWRRSRSTNDDTVESLETEEVPEFNEMKKEETPVAAAPEVVTEQGGIDKQYAFVSIDAIRQHVVAIAAKYPQMVSRSVSDHCMKNSPLDAAYFMESLGWDQSKQIFGEVPSVVWARIGAAIKDQSEPVVQADVDKRIREFYKTILAGYIEHEMSIDDSNPFGFVLKLNEEDRRTLLSREKAGHIGILCASVSPEVTASILSSLEADKKLRVLTEIAKLERLPYDKIEAAVSSFRQHCLDIKNRPEAHIQGAKVLASVIKGMEPEEEMQLLQMFANENPEELERVRRHVLIFDDLSLVPPDILKQSLVDYEVESLYAALFRAEKKTAQAVIASLPEKKAMVVDKELEDMLTIPPMKEIARLRREITVRIAKDLESQGICMSDLIDGNIRSMRSA